LSRSPEAQRLESQRKVLDYIYRQNPRQARPKDLEEGTGLESTLYVVLDRFEKDKVLLVERGRRKTIYKWTKKAEELYRQLIPPEVKASRLFYERLTKRVNVDVSEDVLIQNLVQAMGATVLPVILETIETKKPVDLIPVIDDFKFFIEKYMVYKKYPNSKPMSAKEHAETFISIHGNLKDQPQLFSQQLHDLKKAVDSYKDKLWKEDKTMRELAEVASAISVWVLEYIKKNELPVANEGTWPNFKSYVARLKELQEEMGYPVAIEPNISGVKPTESS
jgi:DNA-binding MarR family transcriptional regulator